MRKAAEELNAWLNTFDAWPVHTFLEDRHEVTAQTVKGLGRTLFACDFVFVRDVMSRQHWQLVGPDASDAFLMSVQSNHLTHSIFELDIDSPELAAMQRVAELTERYRI